MALMTGNEQPLVQSRRHVANPDAGGMTGIDPRLATADNYRRFAQREAAGRSPAYESLAFAVADDPVVLAYLQSLPSGKRQPNLLFAAARYLLESVPRIGDLRQLILEQQDGLRTVMMDRRTQTNEPARCATLLPALSLLPQPLALIEVGASAGLTLLPDRYAYDYGAVGVAGADPLAPTLPCTLRSPAPLPEHTPEVVWRRGIDLNPLDPADDEDVLWLECLIWPGESGRVDRLHRAVEAARRCPVPVHQGDLLDDLATMVAEAPRDGTVVVYHSAVLAYVDRDKRQQFSQLVRNLDVTWLSNEAPAVLDWVPAAGITEGFALIQDGEHLLAETDPHGTWLRWEAPR